MSKILRVICLLIFSTSNIAGAINEKITTTQDQNNLAITIYHENLALIKDSRSVSLNQDLNKLTWHEISAKIQPETALLRNISHPDGFSLREQNFEADLLTPQKLLEEFIGTPINVIRTNPATGEETKESATVLTTNGGTILKFTDRIETGISGRLVFPNIPENLREKPALILTFTNATADKQHLELTYLTLGLSWQADYIAVLNAQENHITLTGMATLNNKSGMNYENAKLQLIAGDLNRVSSHPQAAPLKMRRMDVAAGDTNISNEEHFEYHRYTLQHQTSLMDNQTKQVTFLAATAIPVHKTFLLQGNNYYYSGKHDTINHKIGVFINFQNKGEGMGIPLAKGIVRVYNQDVQSGMQFIGEDYVNHIPNNSQIRLKLGHAFDLSANSKQTDFKKLPVKEKHSRNFETAYQITIKNTKKKTVAIAIHEPIPGDWIMLSESLEHKKIAANLVEWQVVVPAESEVVLTYRVRVVL